MNTLLQAYITKGTAQLQASVSDIDAALALNDTRLKVIMGQNFPTLQLGEDWVMACRANYFAIQTVAAQVQTVAAQVVTLTAAVAATNTAQATTNTALQNRLALAESNYTALVATQHADETALTALQAHDTAQDLRLTAVELLAAAAKAQAEGDATAAATAQATATQAVANAAAAAASAATAINNAATAQATATAAVAANTALAARFRDQRVAYAGGSVAALAALTYPVVLNPAFPNNNYSVELTKAGATLLNVDIFYTNKTATGFTVNLRNTSALTLTIAPGVIDVFANLTATT